MSDPIASSRVALLARFAATLRSGGVVELADDLAGQRISRAVTRFRIGTTRIDNDPAFQIETEATTRSGRTSKQAFSYCDWTMQNVLDTLIDFDTTGDLELVPADWTANDPVASAIMGLETGDVLLAGYTYRFDATSGSIKVVRNGTAEDLDPIHHKMDDVLLMMPSSAHVAA